MTAKSECNDWADCVIGVIKASGLMTLVIKFSLIPFALRERNGSSLYHDCGSHNASDMLLENDELVMVHSKEA